MGRYKQKEIIVRDFEEITVVLENRDTIWIVPKRASTTIIFHRWLSPPLGTYTNWHRFRQKLYINKRITLGDVYRWANQHEIQSQGTMRRPEILQDKARNNGGNK